MNTSALLVLSLFLLFFKGTHQRGFDYFVLSLQWPGTICQTTRYCCPSNGCCRKSLAPTEFTIHGLWPNFDDGSWPACCSQSDFDITKISSLLGELENYWPSLSCGSASLCGHGRGSFWGHEWEKHGTCSYPVIKDEYSYFSTVLDLYFQYNITKIVEDAGFLPTDENKYPLGSFITAIEKAFGASPLLVCKHGAIKELRLCFYKDFTPRDCVMSYSDQNGMLSRRSHCPRYILLPQYLPFGIRGENVTVNWSDESAVI